MRRIILALFAFFVFSAIALNAFAQDPPQESPSQEQAAPQKLVTSIQVKGNKAISTNTIISKIKTRVGSPYQENVVSDDLKRLYLLGFFSDIKIDTEDYKDGVKVIFTVTERPLIGKISFSGIRRVNMKDEKLKELLKSKEGQYLDYPSLAEDVKTIKKLYDKIGYSKAEISYKVTTDEAGKANIEFISVEGGRVRIQDIIIEGNSAFPSSRILGLLKTKRAWFFNAGVLKEDVLKEDMERVKGFYQRQGYADVAAEYEVKPDSAKPYLLFIHIRIQEGKKYLVGNVSIRGNRDIKEKELLARLSSCTPGEVFSQDALKEDVANMQSLYFDRGYIMAEIQPTTSLNVANGRTDIAYEITEHEVNYVDKVKIRGNVKTKDVVIRREMRIHPGDKFDGDKLRRSKERLQNLGFFEDISYDTESTESADKRNLVVEVKETKTGAFSFGGGYSTVDQFVGFVEIEQKNFDWRNWPYFTGAGQNLKFRASIGSITNDFNLSFTEPWMFDYPVSFGFDGYRNEHKRDEDVGYGYDEKVTGGDLRLGKEISEYLRGNLTYRLDQIEIADVTSNASADLLAEEGSNNISSLTLDLTFDSRDNVFDTHKGNVLNGSAQLAGGPLSGDKDFYKFFGRASHFFSLFNNSALEVKGRIGVVNDYGDSNSVPIYERFFAGGAYSIRGYHERKVGPVDSGSHDPIGGKAMLVGNVEYLYPVFSFLKVAAFCDTGNVWSKVDKLGSGGFKTGVGLGFRLKTPIGPITLDYGIPFEKESGEDSKKTGVFHFTASQGF
jgi:outer membrane protein insertion porin family